MPNLTTTTSAVFVPEIWLSEVRKSLETNLIFGNLFKTFPHEGMAGDTLHVPDISDFAVNDMLETGKVTPQAITETEFIMTINKWKETTFLMGDKLKVQSNFDLRNEYTAKAGFAIAKQMEIDLANLFQTNFVGFDADGTTESDAGGAITVAGILEAVKVLDQNDVPQGNRMMIMPPTARNTMLQITQFTSLDFVNKAPTVTKKIGEIFGMEVFVSNLIPKKTFTSLNKEQVIIGHKDAVVTAIQKRPSMEASRNSDALADQVTFHTIYDVALFRSTNAVRLRLNT